MERKKSIISPDFMVIGITQKTLHVCSCNILKLPGDVPINEEIPIYPDWESAKKAGWGYTSHELFSHDGKGVWICPKCLKILQKILKEEG